MIKQTPLVNSKSAENIYILCLNPNCPKSKERCLDGRSLRLHPSECSKYFYPTQSILENDWMKLSDYPNDPLGIAVNNKNKKTDSRTYLQLLMIQFKQKLMKIIDLFENTLKQIYPSSCLEDKFVEVYSLDRIREALKINSTSQYIAKVINNNFSPQKYQELLRINTKIDQIGESFDNICTGLRNTLRQIIARTEEGEHLKKTLPDNFDNKIHYGLIKSKFIGSSKILCENGVVNFPKMNNIASFLPWVYSEKSLTTGLHTIKIHSLKFPFVSNAGLAVLQQHDIDTYPYHYFKSLYNKEGRGFQLVEGSEMEHIIGETATVVLKIDLGTNPMAILYDTELRSKYQCNLQENRAYRFGVYGCGWATQIMQLS